MPKSNLLLLPSRVKNLVGEKFGRLKVIRFSRLDMRGNRSRTLWICQCDCGATIEAMGQSLRSKCQISCGCWRKERMGRLNYKHGESTIGHRSPEWICWRNIQARCYYEKDIAYENYGGRGITVCKRWRDSYVSFLKDMGRKPGPEYSIDRINNEGPYKKSNCKWSTPKEQANNRRPSSKWSKSKRN